MHNIRLTAVKISESLCSNSGKPPNMKKTLFVFLALLPAGFPGIAQAVPNAGSSAIKPNKTQQDLFKGLITAKEDTGKIRLLLSISSYYGKNRYTDSISHYATQAMQLSRKLNFTEGINEASLILCKNYLYRKQVDKAVSLLPGLPKDQQARLHLVIGEYYLFQPGLEKHHLDSAFAYFSKAFTIAKSIAHQKWKHESLIALGKYYFSAGQFIKGKNITY